VPARMIRPTRAPLVRMVHLGPSLVHFSVDQTFWLSIGFGEAGQVKPLYTCVRVNRPEVTRSIVSSMDQWTSGPDPMDGRMAEVQGWTGPKVPGAFGLGLALSGFAPRACAYMGAA
jgi:hypothetical protein